MRYVGMEGGIPTYVITMARGTVLYVLCRITQYVSLGSVLIGQHNSKRVLFLRENNRTIFFWPASTFL